MRRRDFITLLGGTAATWPLAARAQQRERLRQVGVLAGGSEGDAPTLARLNAFREGLAKLGWVEERNLRLDIRFGGGDAERMDAYAAELVRLMPDAIVAGTGAAIAAVRKWTSAIPIVVITGAADADGLIKDITHPEGNITGLSIAFASMGGKWMELLKEAAPGLRRIALIESEISSAGRTGGRSAYIPSIKEAAGALGVPVSEIRYRNAVDIVRNIDAFASEPDGGMIVMPPPPAAANRDAIVELAVQHRLPAIHNFMEFTVAGGLMSYGSDVGDLYRRASTFVDRLLRGAKVSDLPIEFPTRFELTINVRTAKAIGLTIPESLLLRADKVIE
jgi:putative tryptophan/tyrosine transport system substrate-binding protein